MTDECKLHACFAMKLDQRRYKDGRLFVTAVLDDGAVEAIDVRYFVEDGDVVMPTRQGFRIPAEFYPAFLNAIRRCRPEHVEHTVWQRGEHAFRVIYCSDEYGEGVNLRYYRTSAKYCGPEKRGIRLTLPNFLTLKAAFDQIDLPAGGLRARDLFAGRVIRSSSRPAANYNGREHPTPAANSHDSGHIHEAIERFLKEE